MQLPSGPLEAVKVEPDLFVAEEHFTIPVPKTTDTEDEPSAKRIKQELSGLMTYQEFEKASKEGSIALLAHGMNPFQPRPKAAMITYCSSPSRGRVAEFASGIVSSSTEEKPSQTLKTINDNPTDDPDYVPNSQEDQDNEFDDETLLCDEDEVV